MYKRIAVFAALVLGYVLTGMALNASQPDASASPISPAAAQTETD